MTPGHEQPHHRSRDRVAHSPGLVGQERDRKNGLGARQPQVAAQRTDVTGEANARAARDDGKQGREERRDRDRRQGEQRPPDA